MNTPPIVVLREGGGPSGTPVPLTLIQLRISPLPSSESAGAHWITAFAVMTMVRKSSSYRAKALIVTDKFSKIANDEYPPIVVLREGGGPSGTPVPSSSIQFRISPLPSFESARAHWIAACAAMTRTKSRGRISMMRTTSRGQISMTTTTIHSQIYFTLTGND